MSQTLAEFVAAHEGHYLDFDGVYGAQCVDLVQFYNRDVLGFPPFGGNAIDIAGEEAGNFTWHPPSDPGWQPGDVIVWGPNAQVGTGVFGHVAVLTSGAGPASFESFDQNWPVGAPCSIVRHSFAGVIARGTPKVAAPAPPPHPTPAPAPVPAPPAPAPLPAPPPEPAPGPTPAPVPSPPAPSPQPVHNPPVQNPPSPPVVVPDLPPEVAPPPIPEPPIVAEQGVTTSEWQALVRYGMQALGVGTAQLVNVVSQSIWHVGVTIPQSVQLFVGGLEIAGALAVAGYAISRGIRKQGAA